MSNLKIPNGHNVVMPYLIVKDAMKFLNFMKEVFGAKEIYKAENGSGIMHAEVKIGDSVIMFSESSPQWKAAPAGLFIYVEDSDKTYQKALRIGAKPVLPMEDKDYGRSGGVEDPFGNVWWITSIKE